MSDTTTTPPDEESVESGAYFTNTPLQVYGK